MLELNNLTKRFGGLLAVSDISLRVETAEVVGLLGPNGSGKSTVLNLVSGALPVTSGRIVFNGEPIQKRPAHKIAKRGISRTFQLVRLTPSLSVRQNVMLPLAFAQSSVRGGEAALAADAALSRVGLVGAGDMAVPDLNYIDQKRVELARAIVTSPQLLLLDEWMAGLNPTELREAISLIASLREDGMTIMLVEHIMEAVRALCPRSIVMSAGQKIADGPTDIVLADERVIDTYLGRAAVA